MTFAAPTEFRRSITRMARLLGATMPKGELSPMKLSALGILRRGGPMSATALAAQLGILPQSLTRILADLEAEGLLVRSRDARDGREHILQPTTKAVALMRAEGVRRDAAMREAMLRVLTPVEIDLLLLAGKTMDKLADGWSAGVAKSSEPDDKPSKGRLRIVHTVGLLACLALPFAGPASAQSTVQAEAVHVLNRLAFGPRPGDVQRVMQMGADAYIAEQLHPATIPMPAELGTRLARLAEGEMSQPDLIITYRKVIKAAMEDGTAGAPGGGIALRDALYKQMAVRFGEQRLIPAIESPRQLEEVMVDFWYNHFNVVAGKGLDHVLIGDYERDAIRPYVMGRFRDLLGATAKHPAMLFYLDNWLSTSATPDPRARVPGTRKTVAGLNENYARELMELHTIGADGGYSQADVTTLARMLTGWSFDPRRAEGGQSFRFFPGLHDNGRKKWLGRAVPVRGLAEGEWALDVLAASPATARHVAFKLAQYFVADDPPAELVDRLARRFTETDGDIRAILTALFASPEFRDPTGYDAKFKTPYRYVVSTVRAAGVRVDNVRPLLAALVRMGMPLYGCQSPDGYKNTADVWLNPDALAQRIGFATGIGLGRLPLGKAVDGRVAGDPYAGPASNGPSGAKAAADATPPADDLPLDPHALLATLGGQISARTQDRIAVREPSALNAALVLGSPDFMRH